MNIQFELNEPSAAVGHGGTTAFKAGATTAYRADSTAYSNIGSSLDISGFVKDNNAYGGQGKTTEDVRREIGATDVQTAQDYMTVMSNTLSGEDYKELIEDGFSPNHMPVGEVVTVVDEIKTRLAEAGVVIEGYNDNIDKEVLKEITGNPAYAEALAQSFEKYGIEPTEENVTETVREIEKMSQIPELSENAVKYMLQNGMEPTTDNLYRASYSGGNMAVRQGQGYFAEDSGGYYGKKAEIVDTDALKEQMEKVIENAGLFVDSTTIREAAWIVENGILLTADTLYRLHEINALEFPLEISVVADAAARAVADGKRPAEAEPLEEATLLEQAVRIKEEADAISDEKLQAAVHEEKPLQISILAEQEELAVTLSVTEEKSYITARRQLEEIRLRMTVSANYQLLKRGIHLDTCSLEKTVEALKSQEEAFGSLLFKENAKPADSYKLWRETDLKLAGMRMMPAALVGSMMLRGEILSFTLNEAHAEGSRLQSRYETANESYETLMTAPRRDLGDSIQKAFRNVDDILTDSGYEATPENRRAVRILAYNQMEITKEQIERVKEADENLRGVLSEMTPQKTLQMIRDGINPLETSLKELKEYLASGSDTQTEQMEKYSKFLYRLEQNKEITESEKEAYIGIYRMLRQIEKSDGAAVGTVVHNGQEMSFSNLLQAVRTRKAGRIDKTANDDTGLLKESVTYKNSISGQIQAYFDAFADGETERSYEAQEQEMLKEAVQVPQEVLESLIENGQSVTPDNLLAQREFLQHRGSLYRGLQRFDTKKVIADGSAKLLERFTDVDSAREAYDEVIVSAREVLEDAMGQGQAGYIDVKSMVMSCKQLSLAASLSKEENYEIPLKLDGEMTSVNIRITHEKARRGEVTAVFESESFGTVHASFHLRTDGMVSGLVMSSTMDGTAALEKKNGDLCANILKESGKDADVNYICQGTERKAVQRTAGQEEAVSTKDLYTIAKGFLETFAE